MKVSSTSTNTKSSAFVSTPLLSSSPFSPSFTRGSPLSLHTKSFTCGATPVGARPRHGNKNKNVVKMVELTRETSQGTVKRIVVTGTGVVSCFGCDSDVFYQSLLDGKSGARKIEAFDVEGWSTDFAATVDFGSESLTDYVPAKLSRRLDPFLKYAIIASKKALKEAGLGDEEAMKVIQKHRAGVLCGSGMGGLQIYSDGVEKLLTKGYAKMSPFFIPYAITNMGAALIGMELGFTGPNYSVSTACATGNFMINNAAIHIRRGDCDICIAGGAEAAIVPVGVGGFIACRALSSRKDEPTKASRPWDQDRDGFLMGEGAGLLVMESLEHALARGAPILAEYFGGAQSCDAHHITEPRQDGGGVRQCINDALADAGVHKEQVDYINAHATSTPAGDLAEFRAVRSVFDMKDVSHIRMNGTKSMIGHALGAAGGLEAVATVKAIQTGKIHPTINVDNVEPEVDMDLVQHTMQEHDVNVGISNSFGFGGHNSTVVFGKYEP